LSRKITRGVGGRRNAGLEANGAPQPRSYLVCSHLQWPSAPKHGWQTHRSLDCPELRTLRITTTAYDQRHQRSAPPFRLPATRLSRTHVKAVPRRMHAPNRLPLAGARLRACVRAHLRGEWARGAQAGRLSFAAHIGSKPHAVERQPSMTIENVLQRRRLIRVLLCCTKTSALTPVGPRLGSWRSAGLI
jgi:hypothetical protein